MVLMVEIVQHHCAHGLVLFLHSSSQPPTITMESDQKFKLKLLSEEKETYKFCLRSSKQTERDTKKLDKKLTEILKGMETCPARSKKNCK
jgi:hypothetical protein